MSLKITINNEEVVCNNNIQIKEEMLSTSSTILKNCYPKTWELDKDYVSRYYFPKDYSKCKITNDTYHPEEPGTIVKGSNLNINYNNTKKWELNGVFGNTSQNGTPTPSSPVPIQNVTGLQTITRCGKNLFDKENMNTLNAYINGRGIIKTDVNASVLYIPCKPNTSYAIQKPLQTTTSSNRFKVGCCTSMPTAETQLSKYNNLPNGTTNTTMIFETDSTANYLVFNFAGGNQSEYQNVINGIQIEVNNHITSYESYTSQSYEVNLGKNLFNANLLNNISGMVVENNQIIMPVATSGNGYVDTNKKLKELCPNLQVGDIAFLSFNRSPSGDYNNFIYLVSGGDIQWKNNSYKTITEELLNKKVALYGNRYTSGETDQVILSNFQIEKGTQKSSYVPYFTPIELNKIGDYQDRIYKDNGKWYIEKNIQKVVITGSTAGIYQSGNLTNVMRMAVPSGYNLGGNSSSLFCDKLKVDVGYNHDYEQIYVSNNNFYVFVAKSRGVTDVNTFKTWLNSNNLNCYVVLSTPTTTEITNEDLLNQLESIYYMNLKNGVNNIISTSENLPILLEIHYNYHEAYTNEDLIFCGCVKNTGKISLNPREPHFVDLQVLDFKTLLSEGETLNYVITGKTIVEAINQVVSSISDYGFIVGNIEILNPNDIINAYSTLNKTAYDVFQYIADITQSRWTTRMIDENTIAIDFYDPTLMPTGTPIESTQAYYENNQIIDISFNYSTNDYRNKQIMTSDEVYANITQTETIIADGYATSFMCENKIGTITSITLNGINQTFITKNEEQLGYSGDFVYQPGENTFISSNSISAGGVIVITYYAIVKGREIIINSSESSRIETQVGRKGIISRYENRNDSTSSVELQKIGQSYIKYKGNAEIQLKVKTKNNLWNVGEILSYNAPLEELSTEYMVKSKEVDWYAASNETFYIYELTSNFNYENAVNYFDNQRAKNQGNIGEGQTISRNIDLESTALIKFYDTTINEVQIQNPTSLDFALDGVLI